MMNLQEIQQHIEDSEHRMNQCQQDSASLAKKAEDLKDYIDYLRKIEPFIANGIHEERPKDHTFQTDTEPKKERNSNRKLYERIIFKHGEPMHIADILEEAILCGVDFSNPNPKSQLRNALNNSKKTFYNTGSNQWWLVGHPEPGEEIRQEAD